MSAAEVLKHLKVKASSVKRLHKELSYYESERDKEQTKVDAMKASGADASDLKQAENVLQESAMMIPQTRQRLEAALTDLQQYLAENGEDVKDSEEHTLAQEVIAAAKAVFDK